VSADLADNAHDRDDLATTPEDQDRTWHITQYLLPESDPNYDEGHALSNALKKWNHDVVSELGALLSTSSVPHAGFFGPPKTPGSPLISGCCSRIDHMLTI
jgi:hypothetical protein